MWEGGIARSSRPLALASGIRSVVDAAGRRIECPADAACNESPAYDAQGSRCCSVAELLADVAGIAGLSVHLRPVLAAAVYPAPPVAQGRE